MYPDIAPSTIMEQPQIYGDACTCYQEEVYGWCCNLCLDVLLLLSGERTTRKIEVTLTVVSYRSHDHFFRRPPMLIVYQLIFHSAPQPPPSLRSLRSHPAF